MTDPLAGRELVEKSYEYVLKLSKECARSLVEEFNASHVKFLSDSHPKDVGERVVQWFGKREKNVKLILDSAFAMKEQPDLSRMKFKGNTKDADFTFTGTLSTFTVPGSEDGKVTFVKALTFSVDKSGFTKRKF